MCSQSSCSQWPAELNWVTVMSRFVSHTDPKICPTVFWPEVAVSWTKGEETRQVAHIHIQNGASYLRGFRLRFKNADIGDDNLLPLWSDQFFDLLPGEVREATVEIFTADKRPLSSVSLEAEAINRNDTRDYAVPPPPK